MNWNAEFTHEFLVMAKKLHKKYRSLPTDLEEFKNEIEKNPFQGTELTPGIRKIRMAISSKGGVKSKGARIITLTYTISEETGQIVFLLIYDHNQADTVDANKVKALAKQIGYNINNLQVK